MDFIVNLGDLYWNRLLGIPLGWIEHAFKLEEQAAWQKFAWKFGFSVALLLVLYEVYLRIQNARRSRHFRKGAAEVVPEEDSHPMKDAAFVNRIEAAKAPEQTIAALKKAKKWQQLAEVYAGLNRFKEAAWAWRKAGDLKRAAVELANSGNTAKAARWLEKAGDLPTAARFYSEIGDHKQAARLCRKLNDLPGLAKTQTLAEDFEDAAETWLQYFATSRDPLDAQVQAADLCFAFLRNTQAMAEVPKDAAAKLFLAVAARFDAAGRSDLAAQLLRRAGHPAKAAEIYRRLGRAEDAARCVQEASRPPQ